MNPDDLNPILNDLTPQQKEAVVTLDGPLLILAGAGSGKTRVITRRIANLIDNGVPPHNILAITFTNKAAGEMSERVGGLLAGPKPTVSTFHSFCARLLRIHAEFVGLNSNFVIYDTSDSNAALKSCMAELGVDTKKWKPSSIAYHIGDAKNHLVTPEELLEGANDYNSRTIAKVYKAYQENLKKSNAVDFNDLLCCIVTLFEENPEVLEINQDKYRYLLVDEYQDTNMPQHKLVSLLASKYNNLCVTGDPDQTIYSWRGAEITNIMNFLKEYPEAIRVDLSRNYRSTGYILKAANAVISNNTNRFEKDLFTEIGDGELPVFKTFNSDDDEAKFLATQIKRDNANGTSFKDMAIFYRTNGQSRVIEDSLRLSGIPYTIVGGVRFYERAEVKDMLAYLRLMVNGLDTVSLLRVINNPTRGIGATSIQKIKALADSSGLSMSEVLTHPELSSVISTKAYNGVQAFLDIFTRISEQPHLKLPELVQQVYQLSGYKKYLEKEKDINEDRIDNIEALINGAADHESKVENPNLGTFLESIALISDIDSLEDKEEMVTLMTLHSAKGLEYHTVFMAGIEEGMLPHKNSVDDSQSLEEERRLMYVGITRAKRILYLSRCRMRFQWGSNIYPRASRFISEIPDEYLAQEGQGEKPKFSFMNRDQKSSVEPKKDFFDDLEPIEDMGDPVFSEEEFSQEAQEISVKPGDMVVHSKFGRGIILSLEGEGGETKITIQFPKFGPKTLIAAYANLVKV